MQLTQAASCSTLLKPLLLRLHDLILKQSQVKRKLLQGPNSGRCQRSGGKEVGQQEALLAVCQLCKVAHKVCYLQSTLCSRAACLLWSPEQHGIAWHGVAGR
jgi:hypothetical protein